MDFYSFEKARVDLFEDHSYTLPFNAVGDNHYAFVHTQSVDAETDCLGRLLDPGSADHSCFTSTLGSSSNLDNEVENASYTELYDAVETSRRSTSKLWIPTIASSRLKIFHILRKCAFQESLEETRFSEFTEYERNRRRSATSEMRLKQLARCLRKVMATLFWCLDSCFAVHHWCLTRLPDNLLRLYCDAFTELWSQGKVISLLCALNKMVIERNNSAGTIDSPVSRILNLKQTEQSPMECFQSPISSTLSIRSNLYASLNPCRRSGLGGYQPPILACLTFPINRRSTRLCGLLRQLGSVGRVTVESPEEQASDLMRIRLRFYIRRVLRLLEETKHRSAYLVGFGVSSILVLLASIHLHALERPNERPNIAGVICIGMPLAGLKGVRGALSDPLLTIPQLPTLIIVGSRSRLGGYAHAAYFRRQLVQAQRHSPNTMQPDPSSHVLMTGAPGLSRADRPIEPRIHILTVDGADHLLRFRPTTCAHWTVTQTEVDKRVVSVISRFIGQVERTWESSTIPSSTETDIHDTCNSSRILLYATLNQKSVLDSESRCNVAQLPHSRKLYSQARRTHLNVAESLKVCGDSDSDL